MSKKVILFSLFGYDDLVKKVNEKLNCQASVVTIHQFPDEEILVSIHSQISGSEVVFVTSLDRPNDKIIPLIFAAETARELGAINVTLVATYLPYMRQDKSFHEGEGVSARYFAKLISTYFDKLITVDPHLHRISMLDAIYTIPALVIHATDNIAKWIKENVKEPILIGPDTESSQWVKEVAKKSNSPFLILEKERLGDQLVNISIPEIENYQQSTPILIDDIISTARTMIETVNHLNALQMKQAICIGVHAVFANDAYQNLLQAGVAQVVTCNTIQHPTNAIDISDRIIKLLQLK